MRIRMIAAAAALLAVAGCGGSSHERLVREQLEALEEAAAVLGTMRDGASAAAARPKLQAILKRLKDQHERAQALPPLSPEARNDLAQKHEQASREVLDKLAAAARQAQAVPECAATVHEFQREFQRLIR
jgi:hypothetical protein